MKKFAGFLMLILIATTLAAFAETNAWQWQSALVPKARVFEGLWSECFQIEPALHQAGIPYTCASIGALQTADLPGAQDAVIVLGNTAAPQLGVTRMARIKEFVAAGGGLVVLAGLDAFSHGKYVGTSLGDILPVTFAEVGRSRPIPQGLPLTRAPGATWLPAPDVSAKPLVFDVQPFVLKSNAVVQLLAGNQPAIVSGTYGKGRVVAIALTVNCIPPPGTLPFWEWPEWPRLLGQSIDWAAAARPLQVPGEAGLPLASNLKPLSSDELNDFALGLKTPDNLLARALAHPSTVVAEALFAHLTAVDATGKLTLAQALPVLVPYAKPEWGPHLAERLEALNPNRDDRNAALALLGATRWPTAMSRLLPALAQAETRQAAVAGLGNSDDPKAIPLLRQAYDDAIRTSQMPGEPEFFQPDKFAGESAALATEAALALYRLGDTNGIERVLAIYRHVKLYTRIFWTAGRRNLGRGWGDPKLVAELHRINDLASRLQMYSLDKLQRHNAPIPASQLAAFLKIAPTATDPTDVEWLVAEMETSLPVFSPATWQPLVSAKDGIITRLARGAVAANLATLP